eukprot:TRINITY_DN2417_c0_g1_i1.p1 TRINITY_DN2417_c0_g1~~TRINITY_DN2417_c0_g1_i1.p1  ORF type:complete len:141 (-),score=1.39 TRINITY_DN2417_c0_g1_i1:42-464(-)
MQSTHRSSLPFQIFLYFHRWYTVVWLFVMVVVMIYKGVVLPYPSNIYGLEFTYIIIYALINWARIFMGSKGNKTCQAGPLGIFLLLSVILIVSSFYFLLWQIYVVRLDQVVNAISIIFLGIESLLALFCIVNFIRSNPFL